MDWRDVMEQEPDPSRFVEEAALTEEELLRAEADPSLETLRRLVRFYREYRGLDAMLREWDDVSQARHPQRLGTR